MCEVGASGRHADQTSRSSVVTSPGEWMTNSAPPQTSDKAASPMLNASLTSRFLYHLYGLR